MVGDQQMGGIENEAIAVTKMNAERGTCKHDGAIRWTYLGKAEAEREEEKGNRKEATGMGLVELYRLMACNDIYSCSISITSLSGNWNHTTVRLVAHEPPCLTPCVARLPTTSLKICFPLWHYQVSDWGKPKLKKRSSYSFFLPWSWALKWRCLWKSSQTRFN